MGQVCQSIGGDAEGDTSRVYAHSLPAKSPTYWEPLGCHLRHVAERAAAFADAFGAAEWGELLGSWHDLGKYSEAWQAYLRQVADADASEELSSGRVDHSTFGARHAATLVGGAAGQLLAFCIAGHHAGLADAVATDAAHRRSSLSVRLDPASYAIPSVTPPADSARPPKLSLPPAFAGVPTPDRGFAVAFFTRMLFSALVDADRLATEAFCDPQQAAARARGAPAIKQLSDALDTHLQALTQRASPSSVNHVRADVLRQCVAAAALPPGFFSLNVPTGGGKTLSSLAFALRHALAHGLRRVVVAIPFTSIIEQTADVYRRALDPLGDSAVIEHHSDVEPRRQTLRARLATENWDAPLIVTTNVQLYESLFASATTACRKLHRLARSVLVLDEAQTIPVELLEPTLAALKELVARYGCTIVLCTATQPALERRDRFDIGIDQALVRPIVADVPALHRALERVTVQPLGKLTDDELADRIGDEHAALCVVNTRAHARKVFDAVVRRVGRDGCFHLSRFMCAPHRREVVAVVRQRLRDGLTCRLVSTQLVEAGVDIDFPAVYRAPAGFDSIAQAAGRCNREGLLERGRVYLFETASVPPVGLLCHAAQTASELLPRHPNPLLPNAVEAYFHHFYWTQNHAWDKRLVMQSFDAHFTRPGLPRLQFREASCRYQVIRDEEYRIVVPFRDAGRTIRDRLMRGEPPTLDLLRAAQRYTVGVPDQVLTRLANARLIAQHESGLWWLANDRAYSDAYGLSLEEVGMDGDLLII